LAPKCIYHELQVAFIAQIQSDVRKRENYELSLSSAVAVDVLGRLGVFLGGAVGVLGGAVGVLGGAVGIP